MGFVEDGFRVGGDWNMTFIYSDIFGMSSSQLTNIFQRGSNHQLGFDVFVTKIDR